MARNNISPERVIKELAAIGFAEATDFLCIEDGELVFKATKELSKKNRAAIASVERTSNGIRMKLYDKMKALELLGKYLRMFEENEEEKGEENNLLEAILAATRQEVATDDIPEIQQAADSGNDLVE